MKKWLHSCREGMLVAAEFRDGGVSFDSSARKVYKTFMRLKALISAMVGVAAVCRPWQQKEQTSGGRM
jgi:hypothetical protein